MGILSCAIIKGKCERNSQMNSFLLGLSQGAGFMIGLLAVYTVYDLIWERIDAHRVEIARKNAKRRRRGK